MLKASVFIATSLDGFIARQDGALIGVFDMDSPLPGRFRAADQAGMEAAVALLMGACRI